MKLNLKVKEVIQEVIDIDITVGQDLEALAIVDTLVAEAAVVHIPLDVHTLHSIVHVILTMMTVIIDMEVKDVTLLDIIAHLCLAAGGMLETGIILHLVDVWVCLD